MRDAPGPPGEHAPRSSCGSPRRASSAPESEIRRHSNADASRLAALLLAHIFPICALVVALRSGRLGVLGAQRLLTQDTRIDGVDRFMSRSAPTTWRRCAWLVDRRGRCGPRCAWARGRLRPRASRSAPAKGARLSLPLATAALTLAHGWRARRDSSPLGRAPAAPVRLPDPGGGGVRAGDAPSTGAGRAAVLLGGRRDACSRHAGAGRRLAGFPSRGFVSFSSSLHGLVVIAAAVVTSRRPAARPREGARPGGCVRAGRTRHARSGRRRP